MGEAAYKCGVAAGALALALLIAPPSVAEAQDTSLQTPSPATPSQTVAQPGGDPAAADGSSSGQIADIVVSARRRSESLQEVPVAVTAITSVELNARSVGSIAEVAAFTPNLRFSESARGGSVANVTLRGQSNVNNTIANDPSVGIYFDEVYIARSAGPLFTSVQDMESVEVLRGNQGTLFGRNSTGGAILLTPKRPDLTDAYLSGQIGIGNLDRFEYGYIASVPIVEGTLAVRGSFQSSDRDGFQRSTVTGFGGYGDRNRYSGRAAVRWQPASEVTFDLTYDFSKSREAGTIGRNLTLPAPAGARYYDTQSAILNPLTYTKIEGYTFRGVYDAAPEAQVKAIFGYRKVKFSNTRDVDGIAITAVDSLLTGDQDQFSAEIQVGGDFEIGNGWLDKINYVTGFYYFTEKGFNLSKVPPVSAAPRLSLNNGQNDSVAGFAQVELGFTNGISAFGGIRKTHDERFLSVSARAGAAAACTLTGNPPGCVFQATRSFNFISWNVGARAKLADNINVYVRASKGQRSGGLDDTPTSIESFEPEILQDYEIGVKADFFDRHLRTNLAVFTGNYDNVQRVVLLVDPANIPYTSVFNAAKARVRGIEFESALQLIDALRLSGSLGYTDAKYRRFVDTRPGPTRGQDASGNNFSQVPKWTYSLSADLSLPSSAGLFEARVDYSWRSAVDFEVFNSVLGRQEGYGLLNGRIAFSPEFDLAGFKPQISVFGKNLTNRKFNVDAVTANAAIGTVAFRNSDPRTYGVDLKLSF